MSPFQGKGFDVVLACDVLYTPAAVDVIAPLVVGDGGMVKAFELFALSVPLTNPRLDSELLNLTLTEHPLHSRCT